MPLRLAKDDAQLDRNNYTCPSQLYPTTIPSLQQKNPVDNYPFFSIPSSVSKLQFLWSAFTHPDPAQPNQDPAQPDHKRCTHSDLQCFFIRFFIYQKRKDAPTPSKKRCPTPIIGSTHYLTRTATPNQLLHPPTNLQPLTRGRHSTQPCTRFGPRKLTPPQPNHLPPTQHNQ